MNGPPQSNSAKRKSKKAERQTEYFDENEKSVNQCGNSTVRKEPASTQYLRGEKDP